MENVMVFGTDLRGRVRKDFPLVSGAWVEFYDDISMGEMGLAQKYEETKSEDDLLELLATLVADWNFAGQDGNKVNVSAASVKALQQQSLQAFKWLTETALSVIQEANAQDDGQKKDLPGDSSEA